MIGQGSGLVVVVTGPVLVFRGIMPMLATGVDIVIGATPPERTGAASALTETTQELGIALGIAILGSLTAMVYRAQMGDLPGLPEAAKSTLGGAKASGLPAELLGHAEGAFTDGLRLASVVSAIVLALAATAIGLLLRRAPTDPQA
ncbi:hypothetical protein [Saccharopolyspora dendranthemae]|uniref:hypothetical protein n=1 Tax=Saccharopolyspora dendranthemae TaxID=1181886 RepID=UPI001FE7543E|nr:hypothetical protein [Saccharopolyspora dendranthemae]